MGDDGDHLSRRTDCCWIYHHRRREVHQLLAYGHRYRSDAFRRRTRWQGLRWEEMSALALIKVSSLSTPSLCNKESTVTWMIQLHISIYTAWDTFAVHQVRYNYRDKWSRGQMKGSLTSIHTHIYACVCVCVYIYHMHTNVSNPIEQKAHYYALYVDQWALCVSVHSTFDACGPALLYKWIHAEYSMCSHWRNAW